MVVVADLWISYVYTPALDVKTISQLKTGSWSFVVESVYLLMRTHC